jgi:hypothetical protein
MWCQGKLIDFIRESNDKHLFDKIESSDECVRDGVKITKKQLKKMKWNPSLPVGGAWQKYLYHKIMNKE